MALRRILATRTDRACPTRLRDHRALIVALAIASMAVSCATPAKTTESEATPATTEQSLRTQALVMSMADVYMTAMGESGYLVAQNEAMTPKGRWMTQSFLRNGFGAAIDVASGPNPAIALLDLLVLATLQTWTFERHWIPAGIGEAGLPAVEKLKQAEAELWNLARKELSDEQLQTVRRLIDAWVEAHPDQIVVSLVRFEEFADARKINSLSLRGEASGLLKEVTEATGAIDDVRLLGERALWWASRYPYMLGQQVELTTYRMVDQPEVAKALEALGSIKHLSETVEQRLGSLEETLLTQQANFFTHLSEERTQTVEHIFDRVAKERGLLLDDLESREGQVRQMLEDVRTTVAASGSLSHELTGTLETVDRIAARFDEDPNNPTHTPLRIEDVRDTVKEAGILAERLTIVLEHTNDLIESDVVDQRMAALTDPANALIDRAFWRGVVLVGILIVGLGVVRLIPQRTRAVGVVKP